MCLFKKKMKTSASRDYLVQLSKYVCEMSILWHHSMINTNIIGITQMEHESLLQDMSNL